MSSIDSSSGHTAAIILNIENTSILNKNDKMTQ